MGREVKPQSRYEAAEEILIEMESKRAALYLQTAHRLRGDPTSPFFDKDSKESQIIAKIYTEWKTGYTHTVKLHHVLPEFNTELGVRQDREMLAEMVGTLVNLQLIQIHPDPKRVAEGLSGDSRYFKLTNIGIHLAMLLTKENKDLPGKRDS